jgi:hypothetical protein
MKIPTALLASFLAASSQVLADYELGPPETYLAAEDLVVVDASIMEITDAGIVELKTHELVVGRTAPRILRHIALNCEGPILASATGMARGKRYIFVTDGDDLLEWTTFWEVVRSSDGELKCHYSGAEEAGRGTTVAMPRSGLHSLAEFKKRVRAVAAAARHKTEKKEEDAPANHGAPPASGRTASDLAKSNTELKMELQHARAGLRQANMRLLYHLSGYLDDIPANSSKRNDALRLAVKLAPTERGNPLVWRVLHETEVLHDAMSREAAERLLGPPTSLTEVHVEWWCNPHGRHVAPYIRATRQDGTLSHWHRGNR